jgi:DNA repair protein RecO
LPYLHHKIKFLQIAGYSPKLDACGRCSRLLPRNGHHRFYVSQGSLLCRECVDERSDSIELSESALKFYKSLLQWHSSSLCRIRAPERLLSEVKGLINAHIRYRAGGPLKSMEMQKTR